MKTRKQNKQGISLIVLVITIIVMIILAAAVVITLSNSGILSNANAAVKATDLAQMQNLATMLWADAYLDGKTGDELVELVKQGLLEADPNYETKYDVEITDAGVSVTLDGIWEILFEGSVTSEDGVAVIANESLFNEVVRYKITIENEAGDQYVLKTRLIYYTGTETMATFVIGAITDDGVVYFNSAEDMESGETEGVYVIAGQVVTDGEVTSGIVFEGGTYSWTVKKIERQRVEGTLIYEGDGTEIERALEVEGLSITRDYIVICDVQGMEYTLRVGGAAWFGEPSLGLTSDGEFCVIWIQNNAVCSITEGVVIKEIYDIGESSYVKVEDGFVVTVDGDLIGTPSSGEYIIPKSVGGVELELIWLEALEGTAIITHYVEVTAGDALSVEKIIIKKEAEATIAHIMSGLPMKAIDVTDCGDEVVLSTDYISDIETIYVTKNAKENLYADYDNVIGVE